jgi:hypothetical protein
VSIISFVSSSRSFGVLRFAIQFGNQLIEKSQAMRAADFVNEPSPQPERLCRRDPLLYLTAIQ